MNAQTVSYGLLSTSFSRPAGINAENLIQLTKITNQKGWTHPSQSSGFGLTMHVRTVPHG